MTRSEQARLLQRKASQDLAVLDRLMDDPSITDETLGYHAQQAAEKLIKALLALHGHDYPRSHNIGLLMDLLAGHGMPLPERFEAVEALTPFGTVFRYDDLPMEDTPDRHSWSPLLHGLQAYVTALTEAAEASAAEDHNAEAPDNPRRRPLA
jgi:HEPN domain-containing protein